MSWLDIRFTKLTRDQHRFTYRRDDGTGESRDFETRSTLNHDLIHFAVETEAGLQASFYGSLLKGQSFDTLAERAAKGAFEGEWGMTERVVGGLTSPGAIREFANVASRLGHFIRQVGEEPPPYLTADFVGAVSMRQHALFGHWRATPFGGTMDLRFDAPQRR